MDCIAQEFFPKIIIWYGTKKWKESNSERVTSEQVTSSHPLAKPRVYQTINCQQYQLKKGNIIPAKFTVFYKFVHSRITSDNFDPDKKIISAFVDPAAILVVGFCTDRNRKYYRTA
jgi:hypothetical protein